jgi:hypothetical protein
VLLAGCGGNGTPKLHRSDAAGLIALARRIAREGACGQAHDIPLLRRRAIALVNARRVPDELQEPLMSGVAALAEQTPVCLPKVSASSPSPPPARSPAPPAGGKRHEHPEHDRHHERGHGHGHGKGR